MSDDAHPEPGAITWSALWTQTSAVVGDRVRARWLCEVASGADGDDFRAALDEPATERMVHHLDAMLARLRSGEPLQYVLGRWAFRRLDLMVDRRVLIPRPETEQVAEIALRCARARRSVDGSPMRIADLGTGSGAIGLSLADELGPDGLQVWLTDASADALDVARANLAGLGRAGAVVRLAHGDWFDALPDQHRSGFAVIVSNPPYVLADDPRLEPIVRDWEPSGALFAGTDGLDAVRHIVAGSGEWLEPGGSLVLEIGAQQGTVTAALMTAAGLIDVRIHPDLSGHDRVAEARLPI